MDSGSTSKEPTLPNPVAVAPAPPPAAPPKPVVPAPVVAKNGKGAPPPVDSAPAIDADPVLWEGKVDGEMVKVKKSEADRLLSKGKFADRATQEAKESIRKAKEIAEKLQAEAATAKARAKTDTEAWLKEHGIDPDEYAKSRLERKVEEGKMTPEQRRAADLEVENKRLKGEHEKLEQQRQVEKNQQLTTHLQKRIEGELVNAAKRAGMSLGDESFYAVYESFKEAFELGLLPSDENGLLPHHADRIVEDAMEKISHAQKSIRDNVLKLNGQALEDFVGKDAVDKLVANRLEIIRARRGVASNGTTKPAPMAPTTKPSSYISPAELDAMVKKLAGRG